MALWDCPLEGLELMVDQSFWRGKRVLLTGHTGFKGSWLSIWLQHMGCELHGFSLEPPTNPSMFGLLSVGDRMNSKIGDIRDLSAVERFVDEVEPEIVIHMAAQPLVRDSYSSPAYTFATNVTGTVNILEALRKSDSVRVFVNVTTDKCYENREWLWGYREDDHLGGHDPYSASKACSEIVTSAYRRSFFSGAEALAVASARAGNVIGGGDWSKDRLIPDTLAAFRKSETVVIRNPGATRPWQHVLEPLSGYLCLAQQLFEGSKLARDAWNFGPSDEGIKPVEYLVDYLADNWSGERHWEADSTAQPHEANSLKLDITKATSLLGWSPKWNLDQTLESILAWEHCYQAGTDLLEETFRQIKEYTNS